MLSAARSPIAERPSARQTPLTLGTGLLTLGTGPETGIATYLEPSFIYVYIYMHLFAMIYLIIKLLACSLVVGCLVCGLAC
jgi:hypothetical protein